MDCCYNDKCVGSLKKIIWLALEEWKLNSDIAKCIRRVKWLKKKYSLRFALPNNVQVLYGVVVHGGRFEPAWNVRFAQIVFPRNAILCQKIITRKKKLAVSCIRNAKQMHSNKKQIEWKKFNSKESN